MGLNYNSPGALRAFLDERGLGARKRFGQNFLIDGRARERLLDALGCPPGSAVWEVGPGLGAITSGLLDRGMRVTAFEVDGGFAAALEEFFGGSGNFRLVRGDVLRTWPVVAGLAAAAGGGGAAFAQRRGRYGGMGDAERSAPVEGAASVALATANTPQAGSERGAGNAKRCRDFPLHDGAGGKLQRAAAAAKFPAGFPPQHKDEPLYLVGNLPYNIAAALLGDFAERGMVFARMVVTLQREVAGRVLAPPGSRNRSPLSALAEAAYRVTPLMTLGAAAFYPAPRVESQALVLEPRGAPPPRFFFPLVRALFASRRKTARNNLAGFLGGCAGGWGAGNAGEAARAALEAAGIPGEARAESLTAGDFAALARALEAAAHGAAAGDWVVVRKRGAGDSKRPAAERAALRVQSRRPVTAGSP
ncbi:MAG: 16S rRNA (adenine1518-N6/adenine1519-N6)-dimethyltransferase [Treponematales bacterium]